MIAIISILMLVLRCSHLIFSVSFLIPPKQIKFKIKVVSGSPCGAVAAEAKRSKTNWVILDK